MHRFSARVGAKARANAYAGILRSAQNDNLEERNDNFEGLNDNLEGLNDDLEDGKWRN